MKYAILLLFFPVLLQAQIYQPYTFAPSLTSTHATDSTYDEGPTNAVLADSLRDAKWVTQARAADFTAATHIVYFVDATSGSIVVTLPSHRAGLEFVIKRIDDGIAGYTVTINDAVDGVAEQTIAAYKAYRIMSNGTNWYFIGTY